MEPENLTDALKNVRLTAKEVYDDAFREDIRRKEALFDPQAFRALLAIQPGHAWQATIVREEDFKLVNETLINAGPLVVPRSPKYREIASLIRAILPDDAARKTLDAYVADGSYIYPTPIPNQWNPVLVSMSFFRTQEYDSASDTSGDTTTGGSDGNGSITVSLSCL